MIISKILAALLSIYYFLFGWLLPSVSDYELEKNVRYGEAETAVMDVYLPESAADRAENGCVIMIHGGSYSGGDKKEELGRCHALARREYVVATINYTLRTNEGGYSLDLVLDDVTAAISALCGYAAERGITLTAAAVAGYSAGGHIALLYAYTRAAESPLPICFVGTMAGPAEYSGAIWGEDEAYRIASRLTGVEITAEMVASGEADALVASISPTSFVRDGGIPTVMAYGKKDTTVSYKNAEALAAALDEAGVEYTNIRFSRSDHNMMGNPFKRLKYNRTLAKYCNEYFGY